MIVRLKMKNGLLCLLTIAFITCFSSCKKDSISGGASGKDGLEGVWGLVHYELKCFDNGVVQNEIEDFNPYNPSSDGDLKIAIIKTPADKYLVTTYYWDEKEKDWIVDYKMTWTVKGNNIIDPDDPSSMATFKLTSDTLTLEETYSESKEEGSEWVDYSESSTMVFRKMGELSN